jgi:hypothetical protein
MVYDAARIVWRHVQMKSSRNKDIQSITCRAGVLRTLIFIGNANQRSYSNDEKSDTGKRAGVNGIDRD